MSKGITLREAQGIADKLSPATIQAMREWASDCEWRDGEELAEMTDAQIVWGVAMHYDGGIDGFLFSLEDKADKARAALEVPSKRGRHKSAAFFDIVAAMRSDQLLWDDGARTFAHVMGIEMEDGSGRSWILKVRKMGEGAIVPTYWHEERDGGRFLVVR